MSGRVSGHGSWSGAIRAERLLGLTAVAWAIILPLAAYAASRPSTPSAYVLAFPVYFIGSFICHQRPERSFQLWATLPVCARCTGIYVGAAVAALPLLMADLRRPRATRARSLSHTSRHPGIRSGITLAIGTLALAPTVLTLLDEWSTGVAPSNWMRAAAGLPMGAAIMGLIQGLWSNDRMK